MKRLMSIIFLASMILFGAAASSSLYGADEIIEEVDEQRCGGDYDPLCRKRTRKVCTEWHLCSIFTVCCQTWETTSSYDYFPEGDGSGLWS